MEGETDGCAVGTIDDGTPIEEPVELVGLAEGITAGLALVAVMLHEVTQLVSSWENPGAHDPDAKAAL